MILINGEPQQTIAATDRGLQYGDGVFETIAVQEGRPRFWQAHLERLLDSCSRLDIPLPESHVLAQEIARLCSDGMNAIVKLIVTRGTGGRGYLPPASPEPSRVLIRYPWQVRTIPQEGIALRLCNTPLACNPALAGIKHLNRLEQVLARNEWRDETVQEGIMCSTGGEVIEGTMSNLFAVRQGRVVTPDLSGCGVAGVMRRQVLALAEQLGIPCDITRIMPSELYGMDELFVTNSIIGIWPVACYEGHVFGENRITERLTKALKELMDKGDA